MPNGGVLTIEAALCPPDGGAPMVAITVKDDGTGIDEADLEKIFQPFFSAKKGKGIGLGLSICERIIQNHGGKIMVDSKLGEGTIFKIELPIEAASGARPPLAELVAERGAGRKSCLARCDAGAHDVHAFANALSSAMGQPPVRSRKKFTVAVIYGIARRLRACPSEKKERSAAA